MDSKQARHDHGEGKFEPTREEVIDALLRPGRAAWGGTHLAEVGRRVLTGDAEIEEIDAAIEAWTSSPLFRLQELDRYAYARDRGAGKPSEFRRFERWFSEPYRHPIWRRDWRKIQAVDPHPRELSAEHEVALPMYAAEKSYGKIVETALTDVPDSLTDDSPLRQQLNTEASQATSPGWRAREKHRPNRGSGVRDIRRKPDEGNISHFSNLNRPIQGNHPGREVLAEPGTIDTLAAASPWGSRQRTERELDLFVAREEIERRAGAANLTARQEEVLELFYGQELKAKEVALRLEISEGAVYAHLANGRERLREAL